MNKSFSAEFFRNNRKRLKEMVKSKGSIVITANGQLQKAADEAYPFKQDANFWYLTGINEPDFALVMNDGEDYLIAPRQSKYSPLFDGRQTVDKLNKISGINEIIDFKAGWQKLTAQLNKSKKVLTIEPPKAYMPIYDMYANPARANLIRRLKRTQPNLDIAYIGQQLASLRVVKQPEEIKVIRTTVDLTIGALKEVKQQLPKLTYEYEIEAIITNHFLKNGANNAWQPVVAAGDNTCIIHANASDRKLNKSDLVIVDIGALINNYAADLTRTFSIGGQPTARQKALYQAVLETQDFAIGQLKPGISYRECELKVRELTGVKLKQLGLTKNPKDKAAIAKYYPHAPHYLGLNIHDVGDYGQPLEPGMVLTVEPGIYIKEEGIGVRIEDDVLITATGYEVLSHRLERKL